MTHYAVIYADPPEFRIWCAVVDLRLRDLTGRPLADVPVPESWLLCWWSCGVPARIVAQGLSTRAPSVQVTFIRFYTDDPARVIRDRVAV